MGKHDCRAVESAPEVANQPALYERKAHLQLKQDKYQERIDSDCFDGQQ
jgi:hypothetical protein